jgi:hypothetical protein
LLAGSIVVHPASALQVRAAVKPALNVPVAAVRRALAIGPASSQMLPSGIDW